MRLRHLENAHIPLWLLKDASWMMHWREVGTVLIIPTITLACWIAWRSRKLLTAFLPNLAVCFWIGANSIWMLGEFFHFDYTIFSFLFFLAGTVCMLVFGLVWVVKRSRANQEIED